MSVLGLFSPYVVVVVVNVVVVVVSYISPTTEVLRRRDLGSNSNTKDWKSPSSNSRTLVYKASSLTAAHGGLSPYD